MKWAEIGIGDAEEKFKHYGASGEFECPKDYEDLRTDLEKCFTATLTVLEIGLENNRYKVDLFFGLQMYVILKSKYGMNIRTASNSGIWRFLSVCVVPDIVKKRYGIDHPDRFWKKPKRIWLRVLWWYIHLSWQGNLIETNRILKDNSTDEILQLVDRCGKDGYRVDLYREIMKKNSELDKNERRKKQLFRKMMVLNTARVQVLEPELTLNGRRGYVDRLCDYFIK